MNTSDIVRVAKQLAKKLGRSETERDEFFSIACLAIVEYGPDGPGGMYCAGKNAINMHLRAERRRPFEVADSIHHAVTELIDEWKREPTQERAAELSQIREAVIGALPVNQLKVVLRRAAGETREELCRSMRTTPRRLRTREAHGAEALAAVAERFGR